MSDPHKVRRDTRAIVRSYLELLDVSAHVNIDHISDGETDRVIFQIRAKAEDLARVLTPERRTWANLCFLVRQAGAQHGMIFEVGIIEPPGRTWVGNVLPVLLPDRPQPRV